MHPRVDGGLDLLLEPHQRGPGQGAAVPPDHHDAVRDRRPGARSRARPHERGPPPLPDRVGRRSGGAVHRPGHVHQQARARRPARVPTRVRRARPPEGERDRQERAGPGPGEGRRRARHCQLAPRAHQRDRRVRRGRARVRGLQALRRRLVPALRCGRVRRRDDPRDPDSADATARARRRADATAGTGRDAHAEHPARFERDGRTAGMRRVPGVLHRVLAQARSLRVGPGRRRRLRRELPRCARRARAPPRQHAKR